MSIRLHQFFMTMVFQCLLFGVSLAAPTDIPSGSFGLRNAATKQCVYSLGGDAGNFMMASCLGDPKFAFTVEPTSRGTYRLKNQATGQCIYVPENRDGVEAAHWGCWDDPNMDFQLEKSQYGYRFKHANTGRCLYTVNKSTLNAWACFDLPFSAWVMDTDTNLSSPYIIQNAVMLDKTCDLKNSTSASVTLPEGRYDINTFGIAKESVSIVWPSSYVIPRTERSLYSGAGYPNGANKWFMVLTGYRKPGFSGDMVSISHTACLEKLGWTGQISSFTVSKAVWVSTDEDPRVNGSAMLGVGRYNLELLGTRTASNGLIPANDTISGLFVPRGIKVTVYEHKDFEGESKVFYGKDCPQLGFEMRDYGFNDRISSFVIDFDN